MPTIKVTGLPPREGEALSLVAQGLTAKEAARKMGCSARNVDALISICTSRLRARNRVHLITEAFHQGFLRVGCVLCAVSSLLCLTPAADDLQLVRRFRSRPRVSAIAGALPPLSNSLDLTRPHSLVWDDGLFVAFA